MLNLKIRRIIALVFITAFFICAPILILHTTGYRYNFKKQQLRQTGSLVLESIPKNADIFLNNEKLKTQTPLRLTDLFPNEYHIRIEKDGYYPWQKKLNVLSQQTTFAENIFLPKKGEPEIVINNYIEEPSLSPNQRYLIYFQPQPTGSILKSYDLKNQTSAELLTLTDSQQLQSLQWSTNNTQLLVTLATTEPEHLTTYNLAINNPELRINLNNLFSQTQDLKTKWHTQENSIVFALANQQLAEIITTNPKAPGINPLMTFQAGQQIMDFIVHQDMLYYLEIKPEAIMIRKKDITDTKEHFSNQIELPLSDYSFEDLIDNKLVLRDTRKQNTYLINLELDNVLLEKKELIGYWHRADTNHLLLYTESEILNTDLRYYPFTFETITRVSHGISQAQWHPDEPYVMFLQNNKINLIELDKRDIRNLTTLSPETVNFTTFDPKGKYIYYTVISTPGLFRLQIID